MSAIPTPSYLKLDLGKKILAENKIVGKNKIVWKNKIVMGIPFAFANALRPYDMPNDSARAKARSNRDLRALFKQTFQVMGALPSFLLAYRVLAVRQDILELTGVGAKSLQLVAFGKNKYHVDMTPLSVDIVQLRKALVEIDREMQRRERAAQRKKIVDYWE